MIDLKCPKCGSESTTRVPVEIIDDSVKGMWWLVIILGILGVTLSPLVLVLCFLDIILTIIVNIVKKNKYKNEWIMQCSRCNHEFIVPNPYRVDIVNAQNKRHKEKVDEKAAAHREKSKIYAECLNRNGVLNQDETLIGEAGYFGFHKNAFYTANGKLKVSDKAFIVYNDKGSFRIPKNIVTSINKKNYLFLIPTGIEIKVQDKRKKYDFVVFAKEREEILSLLKQ